MHSKQHRILSVELGITFWGQWLIAITLTILLLSTLAELKTGEFGAQYRILAIISLLASGPTYLLLRVYHKQYGFLTGILRLLAGWLLLLASLALIGFATKTHDLYSNDVTLMWAVLGFALQASAYLPLQHVSRRYHEKLQSERTSLIVGTGQLALELAEKLGCNHHEPVVGLVSPEACETASNNGYPVIGDLGQLHMLIARHDIRRLYLALPLARAEEIEKLYLDLLDTNIDVIWVPDLHSMMQLHHSVSDIDGLPAIHLNESPLTANPTSALIKATMDRLLAVLAIIALSPVMLVTTILVKCTSPGPVLFKQNRHGWNGKIIEVWKFRSMRLHDDPQVKQATREDPRVTPIGRFIRRTSIDELPQLFNVLQGRMSLVGPRPHAVPHNDYYTGKITAYMARHRIKPGITGLAQVSGWRGETDTLDKMQRRVELDLEYINNWSLWLDIKILLKTPLALISRNIY